MAKPWMQSYRWPRGVFQSGPEGNWSTFPLNAGTPNQDFNLLVSTNTPYLALPFSNYCAQNPAPGCGLRRGALPFLGQPSDGFSISQSSSWIATNMTDVAAAGWGVLGSIDKRRIRVEVAQPESQLMGTIGLRALPYHRHSWLGTAYLGYMDSFLQTALTDTTVSWSFAYTAGAAYRNADASLIFGGYDSFRLGESAHSFPFSGDLYRPLMARLATVIIVDDLHSDMPVSVLHSPTPVLLDSNSPYFELPEAVCKEFERIFDLELDHESGKFQVNRSTRRRLHERNPRVRFKLTEKDNGDSGVEVELPYASFDLHNGSALDDGDGITYFPLKTATDGQHSVLGRAFFQEAYLIVDYERNNFTLGQCAFPPAGAFLPNATIIDWYGGGIPGLGPATVFLFTVLVGLWVGFTVVSGLPSLLLRWFLEAPRARKLERREEELERLWKEIHTSKVRRASPESGWLAGYGEFHHLLIKNPLQSPQKPPPDPHRTEGNPYPPEAMHIPGTSGPASDEEDLLSKHAISKARKGKGRATPLQISG